MYSTETSLKVWLADLCGNDEGCEQKLRTLLREDREVLNSIKVAFNDRNIPRVHWIIKSFLTNKDIIIRTCKACSKKHFLIKVSLVGLKCDQCKNFLLEPSKNDIVKVKEIPIDKVRRTCMYCSNQVSPLPNAVTCMSCRNMGFNVY